MYDIQGKIIAILPIRSGQGKSGRMWQEQQMVINHVASDQYPKNITVSFRGDVAGHIATDYQVGDTVKCQIGIDAREWNGKWFNEITGYNLQNL